MFSSHVKRWSGQPSSYEQGTLGSHRICDGDAQEQNQMLDRRPGVPGRAELVRQPAEYVVVRLGVVDLVPRPLGPGVNTEEGHPGT